MYYLSHQQISVLYVCLWIQRWYLPPSGSANSRSHCILNTNFQLFSLQSLKYRLFLIPYCAALINAVSPKSFTASILAPFWIRKSTISLCPKNESCTSSIGIHLPDNFRHFNYLLRQPSLMPYNDIAPVLRYLLLFELASPQSLCVLNKWTKHFKFHR